jgi:hypothetical protein
MTTRAGALLAAIAAFAAASLLVGGCADDGPRLLLSIDSDLAIPEELDAIAVTVTASRTPEGALCEPVERQFEVASSGDLPLLIELTPGSSYDAWVAFRVVGSALGAEQVSEENRVPWPTDGPATFAVVLDAACVGVDSCSADEQCNEGDCSAIPSPGLFDGRFPIDEGIPCDAAR